MQVVAENTRRPRGRPRNVPENVSALQEIPGINDRILKMPHVVAVTSCCPANIYRMISRGDFPKGRKIGPGRVGWLASEVNSWIASRIAA